jgi:hypothetical protein
MKTNVSVVCFKFRCNILISGKIIKEMPGSVASGTHCITDTFRLEKDKVRLLKGYQSKLSLDLSPPDIFLYAFIKQTARQNEHKVSGTHCFSYVERT